MQKPILICLLLKRVSCFIIGIVKSARIALLGIVFWLGATLGASPACAEEQEAAGAVRADEWLQEHPLKNGEEIRSDELWRTKLSSIHVVQIRAEEKPHIHKDHDLIVVLQRGNGTLFIGNAPLKIAQGSAASIPRGVPHAFINESAEPAAAYAVFTPPFDGQDTVPLDAGSPPQPVKKE